MSSTLEGSLDKNCQAENGGSRLAHQSDSSNTFITAILGLSKSYGISRAYCDVYLSCAWVVLYLFVSSTFSRYTC